MAGVLPAGLALVETKACPAARHNAAATGWAVTRTAMVSCWPRIHRGVLARAGSNQV